MGRSSNRGCGSSSTPAGIGEASRPPSCTTRCFGGADRSRLIRNSMMPASSAGARNSRAWYRFSTVLAWNCWARSACASGVLAINISPEVSASRWWTTNGTQLGCALWVKRAMTLSDVRHIRPGTDGRPAGLSTTQRSRSSYTTLSGCLSGRVAADAFLSHPTQQGGKKRHAVGLAGANESPALLAAAGGRLMAFKLSEADRANAVTNRIL